MSIKIHLIIIITTQLLKIIKSISFQLETTKLSITSLRKLYSPSSIYGNAYNLNYYYAYLYIGEKEHKQSYILDTGSSVTTSPCNLCENCGTHENGLYEINKDNIIKCNDKKCSLVKHLCMNENDDCDFSISYYEGSTIKGKFIYEKIKFGDKYKTDNFFYFPIGCTNSENHLFKSQFADGIMGLQNTENSFSSVLYNLKIIPKNIFSLCLAKEGGYFSIGEMLNEAHYNNITYVTLYDNGFYKINIINIKINDKVIAINKKKNSFDNYSSIIDSGSTISYFPNEIGNEIYKEIKNICDKSKKCGKLKKDEELGDCYYFSNNNDLEYALDNIMPNISFNINEEYNYIWEPRNYYFNVSNKRQKGFCLGFNSEDTSKFTFGSTWMQNYDFIFDISESKVGIVKSNCNYLSNSNNTDIENKNDSENQKDNQNNTINKYINITNDDNNNNLKDILFKNEHFIITIIIILFILLILFVVIYRIKNRENDLFVNSKINEYSKAEIDMIKGNFNTLEIMSNNVPAINTINIPVKEKKVDLIDDIKI